MIELRKLTKRQVEVLTQIFELGGPSAHEPGNRLIGWLRVQEGLTGYTDLAIIRSRNKVCKITAYGLMCLEPYYFDKARIASAIIAQSKTEADEHNEKMRKDAAEQERITLLISAKKARTVARARVIIASFAIDDSALSDDDVYRLVNEILATEHLA